ncbi:heavy-metal-associated domain-containing protein [Agriterribacter sp.]|jgi:copper chaperone CopZ|uniref:heavy-metal-associated domain-containing protein n=1 Tax=Agriterribacter sp. TaxID=2821509 RepID=UPI002BEB91C9|nr:heavy-metal-associated domain-containing protein [Agriterribacter sp.]HRN48946.1 heavy-metal-associated domain-containing protein [Niabella sp.]HRO48259.1 heavy-metal-associated domain-containing protein [Agriterribacter sp.]
MKSLRFILIAVFAIATSPLFAQQSAPSNTDTIKVYGECSMCKSRIQKALKLEDISAAEWDTDTKLLTVTYDPGKISNNEIQKKVTAVGHDTEKYKADDKVYDKLPGCCKYERKKVEAKQDHLQHH